RRSLPKPRACPVVRCRTPAAVRSRRSDRTRLNEDGQRVACPTWLRWLSRRDRSSSRGHELCRTIRARPSLSRYVNIGALLPKDRGRSRLPHGAKPERLGAVQRHDERPSRKSTPALVRATYFDTGWRVAKAPLGIPHRVSRTRARRL